MSRKEPQEQSLPAGSEARLGVIRVAEGASEAARRAAPERARSTPAIAVDQLPVLPDAIRSGAESEVERFRSVLGRRRRGL